MHEAERQSCSKVWDSFFDQGVDERCQVAVKNDKQGSVDTSSPNRTYKMEFLLCSVLWRTQLGAGSSFGHNSYRKFQSFGRESRARAD